MKKYPLVLLAIALAAPAPADVFIGTPEAIDGDTIALGDQRIDLAGIDAVEAAQICTAETGTWPCGQQARNKLAELLKQGRLECGIRLQGTSSATCQIAQADLGWAMIANGYAVALPGAPPEYAEAERSAQRSRSGIWSSSFIMPAEYRLAHPEKPFVPVGRAAVAQKPRPTTQSRVIRSCDDAWRAGIAPIYRGQPGYRPEWDGDHDGIACEPKRR